MPEGGVWKKKKGDRYPLLIVGKDVDCIVCVKKYIYRRVNNDKK